MKLQFNSKEDLIDFVNNEIVNTTEASEILNCTRQNIYKLVKNGVLVPIKVMEKDRLFFKADILARKKHVEEKKRT